MNTKEGAGTTHICTRCTYFVLLMKNVLLQFPTIMDMINFSLFANIEVCEADRQNFTLECEMDSEDIELAKKNYNALVLSITDPLSN